MKVEEVDHVRVLCVVVDLPDLVAECARRHVADRQWDRRGRRADCARPGTHPRNDLLFGVHRVRAGDFVTQLYRHHVVIAVQDSGHTVKELGNERGIGVPFVS
jgi:hypothetical protein